MTNPNRPTTTDYAPSWKQCSELKIADSCPERLTDAIGWLQKVHDLIPEACRPSARLEVDDDIYVRYVRPMNDREFETYRQGQQWQERQERETLDRLIAKYGVPSGS